MNIGKNKKYQKISYENDKRVKNDFVREYTEAYLSRSGVKEYAKNDFFDSIDIRSILKNCYLVRGDEYPDNIFSVFDKNLYDQNGIFHTILRNVIEESVKIGFENKDKFIFPALTEDLFVKDFKKSEIKSLDDLGLIQESKENKEHKLTFLTNSISGYTVLKTFSSSFGISRVSLINDDQSVFTNVPYSVGTSILRTIENECVSLLSLNPVMADGNQLFSTAHNNVNSTAFGIDSVMDSIKKLGKQKDVDGKILDIKPDTLVVPTSLLGSALTLNESTKLFDRVLSSNLLDDISETKFYILSSDYVPLKLCKLINFELPQVLVDTTPDKKVSRWDIGFDGIKFKVLYDFGLVAHSYKGIFQGGV